jgi:hypothetical protein
VPKKLTTTKCLGARTSGVTRCNFVAARRWNL